MKKQLDVGLYLVTDRELALGRPLSYVVGEALKGGVSLVQLREKNCSSREFFGLAVEMKKLLSPFQVPLIINDRLDIVLAAGADGLHIGQNDLPFEETRRILGEEKIIGLSVENLSQTEEAGKLNPDYIAISPVYATGTKTDTARPLGLEGVRNICSLSPCPVVAIGGINRDTAPEVLKNGADGIAVVSAIMSATDPRKAAAGLWNIVQQAKQSRE